MKEFEKKVDYFLNKSVMLYGASKSGKSTIIRDLLYLLKPHIPNATVICPTNDLNKSYDGFIPKQLIHSEVTEQLLNDILKRQSLSVKLYNMSNNLGKLQSLYELLYRKDDETLEKIQNAYETVRGRCQDDSKLDAAHDKNLIAFYKKIISKNIRYLDSMPISDQDKTLIRNININPNFLIIIDDAAVSARRWCKYNSTKELFFNGRHHRITFMISFQDDMLLDSMFRKNAFINIFTTEQVCNAFFHRPSNNFTKKEKEASEKASSQVFGDSSARYRKLVYLREEEDPFLHYTAEIVPDFIFGSSHLIKLCGQVSRNENEFDMFDFEKFF